MFDLVVATLKRVALWTFVMLAALCAVVLTIGVSRADDSRMDALIISAIDISGSMDIPAITIEIEGIAMAIQAPDVLAAIQRGKHGRIGFAIYLWSDGDMPVVAGWRVIADADDAAAVAAELLAATADIPSLKGRAGALTNLTDSILNATALLAASPFQADRHIVNIVTDGNPTERESDVPLARATLLATGATLNGMIVGGDKDTAAYFRTSVIGGRGAFLITASKAESLVYAFRRKFGLDLAMVTP